MARLLLESPQEPGTDALLQEDGSSYVLTEVSYVGEAAGSATATAVGVLSVYLHLRSTIDSDGWNALSPAPSINSWPDTKLASGWTVGTGVGNHSEFEAGVQRAASTFTSTTPPAAGGPGVTLNESFRSALPYSGTFAAGDWEISFEVSSIDSDTAGHRGQVRYRVYKGNASGSVATELTSAQQVTAQSAAISRNTSQAVWSSVTLGSVTFEGEYLFVQVAWERTVAGSDASADVHFIEGTSYQSGTYVEAPLFTPSSLTYATGSATGSATATAAAENSTADGSATGSATATGVAGFASFRRAILNGIDSAQSEAAGWDALKSTIAESAVVRDSSTQVTVTLPALASYAITANETLTVTVPGAALTGGADVVATPTITVTATGGASDGSATGGSTVTATGQSVAAADGAATGSATVTATAQGTITADGAATGSATAEAYSSTTFNSLRQAILDGITSNKTSGQEPNGWEAQRSSIPVTAVVRTSDTVATVTLPALGTYDITANETLTVTLPAAVLTGGVEIEATPTILVTAAGVGGRVSDMLLMGVGA